MTLDNTEWVRLMTHSYHRSLQVPHEVSENAFWQRYFRSKNAQKGLQAGRSTAGPGQRCSDSVSTSSAGDSLFAGVSRRGPSSERMQYPDTAMVAEELPVLQHGGGYGLAEPVASTIGASGAEWHTRACIVHA